jgi:hypothetical protein
VEHLAFFNFLAVFAHSLGFAALLLLNMVALILVIFSNLIPDWLRCQMRIAVISDGLCCFFTSHPIFIIAHFLKMFVDFLYFWHCVQNCYCELSQKKHCKPRATCTKVDFRETDCKLAGINL